jgi:hypothetical protein
MYVKLSHIKGRIQAEGVWEQGAGEMALRMQVKIS